MKFKFHYFEPFILKLRYISVCNNKGGDSIKIKSIRFQVFMIESRLFFTWHFLHVQSAESCRKASESSTRSVTAEADTSSRRTATKIKREPATTTTNATTATIPPTHPQGLSPSEDLRDEPGDFIETNCHWRDCSLEFPTQVIYSIRSKKTVY